MGKKVWGIWKLKALLKRKGYLFFDKNELPFNLNIIGIRSKSTEVTDLFDDEIHLIFRMEPGGDFKHFVFPATCDPGKYWIENPMNTDGCAIMVPGQYIGAYGMGKHQGKYDALCQIKPVKVWRDNNRDTTYDYSSQDEGIFGINIHRSNPYTESSYVGKWSAGCQVLKKASDFKILMDAVKSAIGLYGNEFTYTLITEEDF